MITVLKSKMVEQIKLNKYLEKLKKSPNCNKEDLYKWADYIELKCIANKDGFYSFSDFIDDIRPRAEDLGEGDFEDTERERRKGLSNAQKNDKWETLGKEVLKIVSVRTKVFAEFYPFDITENNLAITFREKIEINQKVYIFLLLSANLQYSTEFLNLLTGSFEYMCGEVLKSFLPEKAEIKIFASSNTEDEKPWKVKISKFWDKLLFLESFLKEELKIKESDISKYNKGDGGLDIVAKLSSCDDQSHFPIYFAQCACSGDDWIEKQAEIKKDAWSQIISLKTIPTYYMFIPQSYRDSKGDWFSQYKIRETILIDRQRMIYNFKEIKEFENYKSFEIVNMIVNSKESIV